MSFSINSDNINGDVSNYLGSAITKLNSAIEELESKPVPDGFGQAGLIRTIIDSLGSAISSIRRLKSELMSKLNDLRRIEDGHVKLARSLGTNSSGQNLLAGLVLDGKDLLDWKELLAAINDYFNDNKYELNIDEDALKVFDSEGNELSMEEVLRNVFSADSSFKAGEKYDVNDLNTLLEATGGYTSDLDVSSLSDLSEFSQGFSESGLDFKGALGNTESLLLNGMKQYLFGNGVFNANGLFKATASFVGTGIVRSSASGFLNIIQNGVGGFVGSIFSKLSKTFSGVPMGFGHAGSLSVAGALGVSNASLYLSGISESSIENNMKGRMKLGKKSDSDSNKKDKSKGKLKTYVKSTKSRAIANSENWKNENTVGKEIVMLMSNVNTDDAYDTSSISKKKLIYSLSKAKFSTSDVKDSATVSQNGFNSNISCAEHITSVLGEVI